jgi:4-amino-4-deoxy-L-arabinose transferase-like glycosyltransferase
LAAGAAVLRFATLDRQSFWVDELVTVSLVRRSFVDMLNTIPHSEATPYLYYVLAWPWARLFGSGEAGLRSLSAVAGTATVVAAYGAGAALISRRVGLIAAALVAVNPFLLWYSQEARAYALVTLFVAIGLWFFGRALNGERGALAGWAVASGLALATHYFAVFVVAPEALWLLARVQVRRHAALASLVPAAVLLAHLPLILDQRDNGNSVAQSSLALRVAGIPKDLAVGYSFPAELAGSVIAAALLLVGIFLLATRTAGHAAAGALVAGSVAACALVVPVVLALLGMDYVLARNAIVALPPAVVCLAAGYAANRAGLLAGVALCALLVAIGLSVSLDSRYGRTDWRGFAGALGRAAEARALVVSPDIDAMLGAVYLPRIQDASDERLLVHEIVVAALATQGGFSTGAVKPTTTAPRKPPAGFVITSVRRTSTFVLVRYRAARSMPIAVSRAELTRLALVPGDAGVLLQRP